MKFQKFEEAIKNWNKAIEINPNFIPAYIERGHTLSTLNRLDEALESYNKAYILNPDYKFLLGDLIHAKFKLCSWKSEKENLEKLKNKIIKSQKSAPPFPILSLLAISVMRFIPAFNSVILAVYYLKIYQQSLKLISREIDFIDKENLNEKNINSKVIKEKTQNKTLLSIENLNYQYEGRNSFKLIDINLEKMNDKLDKINEQSIKLTTNLSENS